MTESHSPLVISPGVSLWGVFKGYKNKRKYLTPSCFIVIFPAHFDYCIFTLKKYLTSNYLFGAYHTSEMV